MDIGEGITFPMKDKEWISKILIGGILSIIPIVNFIVFGYNLKIMKNAIDKKPSMAKWTGFGDYFVKGLLVFIIVLIFMIIPIIIFGAAAVVWGFSLYAAGSLLNPLAMFVAILPLFILALIVMLIIGFIIPMAIAQYASSDNFGHAFKLSETIARIKSVFGEYVVVYIVLIVLCIILGAISMIPFIGWIIGLFASFYVGVVAFNMFGQLYSKSKA